MIPGINTGGGGLSNSASATGGTASFGDFNVSKGSPVYYGGRDSIFGPLWGNRPGAGFSLSPGHVVAGVALVAVGFGLYKLGGK